VAELAVRQHGVVSVAQLRERGLSYRAVEARAAAGSLHRLHRGVYAVGHARVSKTGRYLAAVLACGPGAALSHRAAADHLGLRPSSCAPEVTVPRGRIGPRGVRVHRSRMLEPRDFTVVDGIPVTTVARTLLDLAAVVHERDVARATDRAERLELFDLREVDDVLGRARGKRGASVLRKVVAAYRPLNTIDELEARFAELVGSADLPPPEYNALIAGEARSHWVDAYWPRHRLVVELDSYAFHRNRVDLQRDGATEADLELAGYRVTRLNWNEVVVHRERTLRRLRRLLA
jgi:hypothetical protein